MLALPSSFSSSLALVDIRLGGQELIRPLVFVEGAHRARVLRQIGLSTHQRLVLVPRDSHLERGRERGD